MTFDFIIGFFLSGIFTLLLIIAKHITSDDEITELLKQIRDNTRDKSIPVKPVGVKVENKKTTKWANCPVCESFVSDSRQYCDKCGAKFDWSDTE